MSATLNAWSAGHKRMAGIMGLRIGDLALIFFIFSTVVFNEGASINVASKLLLVAVTVFECVRGKRFEINGFIVAALVFVCVSAASLGWSLFPEESLMRIKTLVYQLICYTCVIILVRRNSETLKICLVAFVVSAIISAVFVVCVNGVTFQDNRYSEGVVSSGQLALTACFSMMLCVLWYSKEKRLGYLMLLSVFAFFLLLTSSRRDLIIFCIFAVLYYSASSRDVRGRIGFLIGGVALCAGLLFLCLNVDFLYQFVGRRLESFLSFVLFGVGGDASTTGRSRLIEYGIDLFKMSPVLGNGIGTFESLFSLTHGSWQTSADNNYVELLADLGVLGFVAYYVPLALFLLHGIGDITEENPDIRFGVIGVIAFSSIDFACVWFFSKCGMLMILFFYLMSKQGKEISKNPEDDMSVSKL